ncbi:MAG: transporter permease [Frankiales bacterium]|nr:transporter permease [Frankiales bacterium]
MNIPRRGVGFERFSGLYLWAALIIGFSLWQPDFFPTSSTVHSIAGERSISAILALAIIIPLACGAFDLSVGAVANFATINAALLINDGWSWPAAAVMAVLISTAIGAVNGLFVVRLHVSSFITTLGIGSVITALQIVVTDNLQPVAPNQSNESWANFTNHTIFGFQIVFLYLILLAFLLWWVLEHTPVGRYLYAIGSSPDAARLSGVAVNRFTWLSLIASATLAGVGGVMFSSLTGPSLTYGGGLLLPAFAAAFLGSTQIVPGRFNVWGTVMSIFVLATGVKGLQIAYPQAQWLDPAFSGAALVLAVAVAVGRQRSGEERTRKRLSRKGSGPRPDAEASLPGQTEHAVI